MEKISVFSVYRLQEDKNSYVFLPMQFTSWSNPDPPKEIITPHGKVIYVKSIRLSPSSTINGIDAETIIENVKEHGSYFRKFEPKTNVSQGGAAIGGGILGGSLFGPAGALIGAIAGLAIAEHHSRTAKDEL